MTDIVERLRSVDPLSTEGIDWTLLKDAADEIERLRAKLSLAETAITQFDLDAKEAAAEIKRLRTALKAIAENDYQELTPEDFASVALNLLCKGLARRR